MSASIAERNTILPMWLLQNVPRGLLSLWPASSCSRGLDVRAVDDHGNAALEHVDGEHQQSLMRPRLHQDAFHANQRSARDARALSLLQVWKRKDTAAGGRGDFDRADFVVGNGRQIVPPLAEQTHDASRLDHLDVRGLVHRVLNEEIAGK